MEKLDGISFEGKEKIISYMNYMDWERIEDITLALALYDWCPGELYYKEVKSILSAKKDNKIVGPFSDLKETFGYPIYRDQYIKELKNYLKVDNEEANRIRKDLGRKKPEIISKLENNPLIDKKLADTFVKYGFRTVQREYYVHLAKLIYESIWIKSNYDSEYLKEKPITIILGA